MTAMSGSEGKTLDSCDACEINPPMKYCVNCKGNLCSSCAESHQRVKISRDHIVYDIVLDNTSPSLATCSKHIDEELEYYCEDCVKFCCKTCKCDHINHQIKQVDNDGRTHKEATAKFLKILASDINHLQEYQTATVDSFISFENAIENVRAWEEDSIATIRHKAKAIISDIEVSKEKYAKWIQGRNVDIESHLCNANNELSKVQSLLTIGNARVLSAGLATVQLKLTELADIKKDLNDYCPARFRIDSNQLLNIAGSGQSTQGAIASMIAVGSVENMIKAQGNALKNFTFINPTSANINKHDSELGYKFMSSDDLGNIIIHGRNTSNVKVLNFKSKSFQFSKSINTDLKIWNLVNVSANKYVAVDHTLEQIHMLDAKFTTTATLKSKFSMWAIVYISLDRFLVLETTEGKFFVILMRVTDDGFYRERTITCSSADHFKYAKVWKGCLYLAGHFNYLCRLDLVTEVLTKIKLPETSSLFGLHIDPAGNFIMNNNVQEICIYDNAFHYKTTIKVPGGVRDVSVRDGHLLVTTNDDNKILRYD